MSPAFTYESGLQAGRKWLDAGRWFLIAVGLDTRPDLY